MEKRNIISWGQLLILLLICRIFTLMTFVPLVANGYTPTTQFIATIISVIIQAISIIPLIYLGQKYPNKSVTELALDKNKILGIFTAVLYLAFFIFYTVNAVIHFERFINTRFFPTASEYIWIGIFLLICVYCASLGIEGLARSSVLLFVVFIAMLIVIVITSRHDFDMVNLYYDNSYKTNLYQAVLDDLARNGEIIALAFLARHVKGKFKKSSYGLLVSKLLVSLAVAFMIVTVLGDFAVMTDYPFLTVGSYAGVRFLQRTDSIFMVLWTMTSVIAITLFIHIIGGLFGEIIPKMKLKNTTSALIVFCIALPFVMTDNNFSDFYQHTCSGYAVILLAGVIPLILVLILGRRKHNEAKN